MVLLLDSDCDRCKKRYGELIQFKFEETISYRGRVIERPWLCWHCMLIEKRKWWKRLRAGGSA